MPGTILSDGAGELLDTRGWPLWLDGRMVDKPVRVAALYDIHGNLPALEAVLATLQEARPDLVIVGGDVAGGPFPRQTTDLLMNLPYEARFVMGNGDRELIQRFDRFQFEGTRDPLESSIRWCAKQLTSQQVAFLRTFEKQVTVETPSIGSILFCHGSPRSDEEIVTPATPVESVGPMLQGVSAQVVVLGHTHMQFDREVSGVRLVNAGSVGMPYERAPGAYWASVTETIELHSTPYDFEGAAERIRSTEWPLAEEFAAENVVSVPTPEEAIAIFEPSSASE